MKNFILTRVGLLMSTTIIDPGPGPGPSTTALVFRGLYDTPAGGAVGLVFNGPVVDPVIEGYRVTVEAGTVSEDLVDFPLMIDLAHMPTSFWGAVAGTGDNIRAFAFDGETLIPHDVTYLHLGAKQGRIYTKVTLAAGSDTHVVLKLLEPEAARLANDDANGRNAVWSDYEAVFQFPSVENRTGHAYAQTFNNVPWTTYQRVDYHAFGYAAMQGVATDEDGAVVTINENYLRRYNVSNMASLLASNSNPVGAINTATGGAQNFVSDGFILDGELWVPAYQTSGTRDEYFAVFNLATLALDRTYATPNLSRGLISGICYDPDAELIYGVSITDTGHVFVFNMDGTENTPITLSSSITGPQGVTLVDGALFVSSATTGDPVVKVDLDGTVHGPVYYRPTVGTNQGISFDGEQVWIMALNGAVEMFAPAPSGREDWLRFHSSGYATINDIPRSTVWTVAASIYWTIDNGDIQNAFLSVNQVGGSGSLGSNYVYDNGPDVMGIWNSTDGWVWNAVNPGAYDRWRGAFQHDGTSQRRFFHDGAMTTDPGSISARPGGVGASMMLNINSASGGDPGEAYYQNVWIRSEYMSQAWMEADYENMEGAASFYSVSEIIDEGEEP